jgi:hypothetical protein
MTRNSMTGQVKAISMIIAMENFIPDRRAASAQKKSDPAPTPRIYPAACPPSLSRHAVEHAVGPVRQQATTIGPQPSPAPSEVPELHVPLFASIPDMSSIKKNLFVRPR